MHGNKGGRIRKEGVLLKKYKFNKKLKEALLIKVQNRPVSVSIFLDGEETRVKCSGLESLRDGEYSCLVSENSNPVEEGRYVLEAVSFSELDKKAENWICTRPEVYKDAVGFFIENNHMKRMVNGYGTLRKCISLENYGADFVAGDIAIGIRYPLVLLNSATEENVQVECHSLFDFQIKNCVKDLVAMQKHYKRVIILTVCPQGIDILMDARKCGEGVKKALRTAVSNGLEFWTSAMRLDAGGISLISYKNVTDRVLLD